MEKTCRLSMYIDVLSNNELFDVKYIESNWDGKTYKIYIDEAAEASCSEINENSHVYDGKHKYYVSLYYCGLHTIDPETGEKNYLFPAGLGGNPNYEIIANIPENEYEIDSNGFEEWYYDKETDEWYDSDNFEEEEE